MAWKTQLLVDEVLLTEFEHTNKSNAVSLVAALLDLSPATWTPDPEEDIWTCGLNVIQIVEV